MKNTFKYSIALCLICTYANAKDLQNMQNVKLDKITTTANKYESEIFEVSSNVEVASEKIIKNAEIKSTNELSNTFAGLNIYSQGSSVFPAAVLRGLSSPDFYNTVVNLYIDGVPQTPNFLLQALGDVEQVELLRGPQGTLYGENSQAGLISIITKNPMHSNYANISLIGSRLYEDIHAYAGEEIIKNKLWIKGNIRYMHDNGYTKNPNGSGNLNTADTAMAGFALYFAPLQDFLATLNYNYFHSNSHSPLYYTKNQFKDLKLPNGGSATMAQLGQDSVAYNLSPFDKMNAHNASLKLEYFMPSSTLSSVSAFGLNQGLNHNYPAIELNDGKNNGYFYNNLQFIEEIRLDTHYDNDATSVFGIYYKYLSTDNGMRGYRAGANPGYTDFGFRTDWRAKEVVNTVAIFGDGRIPLGEKWDFGLGARYQYYHASMDSKVPPVDLGQIDGNKGWHSFNPRISIGFSPNNNARFYIAATQSTKQGGFVKYPYAAQDTIPYNPEQIYSAEVGSHLLFLDSKLRANVAYYFMYIKDRQAYVGSSLFQSLKNIGDAYSTGIEFDIGYYGDRIYANLGANIGTSQYFKGGDNNGVISIVGQQGLQTQSYNVGGQRLKFSPLLTLNANVDWNFLRLNAHRFYIGLNGRFLSDYYLDDLDHNKNLIQKSYVIADLNLRYEYKNMSLKIFSQNTLDSRYAIYGRDMGRGAYYYLPGNPWNVGAQVAYRY